MVVRAESGGCERARGAVSTREQSARVCIKFVLNVLVRTLKGHVTAGAQGYILGQRGARWAGDVSRSPGNPFRSLSSQRVGMRLAVGPGRFYWGNAVLWELAEPGRERVGKGL